MWINLYGWKMLFWKIYEECFSLSNQYFWPCATTKLSLVNNYIRNAPKVMPLIYFHRTDTENTIIPLDRASFQLQNTIFSYSNQHWLFIFTSNEWVSMLLKICKISEDDLFIHCSWLIDFNRMSICIGLFYAKWLGNHVHCTFISTFFCAVVS